MSLVHNERTKLTATWLNGISIAMFAVGGLAPPLSGLYGNAGPTALVALISVVCFAAAGGLHFMARHVLKSLRP